MATTFCVGFSFDDVWYGLDAILGYYAPWHSKGTIFSFPKFL
jgi:hypothetical protein